MIYNIELRRQICAEYLESNLSVRDLENKYKISKNTISKFLKEYNIVNKRAKRKLLDPKEIIRLYIEDKMSCDEIGKIYNMSRHPIADLLKSYGVYRKNQSGPIKGKFNGKRNPNWKGGITKYISYQNKIIGFKYKLQIWAAKIFERDNIKCAICGKTKLKMQAHHIIPVREIDNENLLFDINNGICLCSDCHKSIHMREKEYANKFRQMIANGVNSGKV